MANINSLVLENLSRQIEVDPGGQSQSVVSRQEQKVAQEMLKNGMEPAGDLDVPDGFASMIEKSLKQVNQYQKQADKAIREVVAGRSKNVHEAMLAIERADVSLKLAMQVRNKIIDAYREVMRMQV